jgi:hypothetical protein
MCIVSRFSDVEGSIIDLMVGWDAPGKVLDIIVHREVSTIAHDGWGHYAGDGIGEGWGVPDEQEVSVEVCSVMEDSKQSSACRCCSSLRRSVSDLLLRTATPSVLPKEAARALVPISDLSFSLRSTSMLPLALSEALGISLSEVMAMYFDGACSIDEAATQIAEDIDRRIGNGEGETWLANEQQKIQERMDQDHQGAGVDDIF